MAKLPQPQVNKVGVPGSTGIFQTRIKAYGKMWDYEYATPDYPMAKRMAAGLNKWIRPRLRMRAIIKKFYEGKRPWYVIYARYVG
jgi:hypothetical protein